MNFFKKNNHNEEQADVKNTAQTTVEATSAEQTTTEKAATEAPAAPSQDRERETKEVVRPNLKTPDLQAAIRQEAKKLRITEQQLSEPHLARVEESLQLNETKMQNIEDNLASTRRQQERVRRYQELLIELNEQKQHLFDVNKQLASNIRESEDLERFETFENVQGQFQRLTVLENLRREQKLRLSELARDLSNVTKELEDDQKRLNERKDEMRESNRRLSQALEAVEEAHNIEGRNRHIEMVVSRLEERSTTLRNRMNAVAKEEQELQQNIDKLGMQIDTLRTRRQSTEAHQRMTMHGELVLERLTRLDALETELAKIENQQKDSLRKQNDENEMLSRVYADYQQIQENISAIKDELHVHRENNHGLDSYRLQERAMQLKLRREMLLSAQSLWARIAKGYELIEDATQHINALRLEEEDTTKKIDELDKNLSVLRRTCHEKEYTFTLSKSQNVIQLRSDLREGTQCTVCGATHHPFHSDTMLEQNKLISEFKSEYEEMATELRSKEQLLKQLLLDKAGIVAHKEELENTLITLRELQNGYTHDWQLFSRLDRTFEECDSSTNAEARTAMLRQLVENIGTEVDNAQKELDTYNFHQSRINELTEQLAVQEQRRSEVITRLNEVNTGCQVIAGQLERITTQKQAVSAEYGQMFESLDKMITIPDWLNTWKRSHESLIMRIQEMTKEWNTLMENLQQQENECRLQEKTLQNAKVMHQTLLDEINQLTEDIQNFNNYYKEGERQLEKLLGNQSSKEFLQNVMNDNQQCRQQLDEQQQTVNSKALLQREMEGRQTENNTTGSLTDEHAAAERQGVDLWIQKYNANHPPVQYSELENVFGNDRNWNDLREQLRGIQMDSRLTQARVDQLRSQMVALQAEGSITEGEIDLIQHQLSSQIETLESRRRDTMMTIAELTLQINAHKRATALIREEKMKE